ncbi:MAG: TonB-dependent receptor [Desulfovermiculus sp.]|nr:TonB-dependent receptor [Desulfovermiculus sp.]
MIRSFFFIFIVVGLCIGSAGAGRAEDEQFVATLDEVVVTSSRLEEAKREVTSNITVVDEEEIKSSSARDLGELLAEKNIGAVRQQPGSLTSIGLRGFRTESHGNDLQGKVLILLNGRRAGTGNVAQIMTENIERVEIIRGPASVQYGSAAIGGVINVITKQGQGKPSGFVRGMLGSFGYEKAAAGVSGKVEGFDFSGAVSRSSLDDYDTGAGKRYENTGYDKKDSGSLNLGYEFWPHNRVSLIYSGYYADNVGSPNMIEVIDPDTYIEMSNESIDFVYDGGTHDALWSWKARYFRGKDEYAYNDPLYPYERETDQEGAQAQVSWSLGQYRLTAGFDWINYEIDSDLDPKKSEYDNPSYFLLGKASYFDERLILSGGLRYDKFEVDIKEGQGGSADGDHISPRFGLAYFLMDNLKLRANYGQGFKMPSAEELAGSFVSSWGTQYQGNPNLDPERSETYEAGLDWYQGALDASLTYFTTDFEDKIEVVYIANGTQTWENIGEATVSGFDGQVSYDVGGLFDCPWEIRPYVGFTYLTEFEDEKTGKDLLFTSDMNVSYGLTVSDLDGFLARLNVAYVGEQDIDYYDPNTFEQTRMEKGGFSVANLTIQKRILDFNSYGDLSLRGEVHNLFDKDYAYVKGYPMPGRSFVLGMEYTF